MIFARLLNLNVTIPYSYIHDHVVDRAQYSELTIKMETDVVMITEKFTILLNAVQYLYLFIYYCHLHYNKTFIA